MATKRLYYEDSHLVEFDARVVSVADLNGKAAIALDQTAFYPTGGGQPYDTGSLGEARVVDCVEGEDATVLHIIEGTAPAVGATVKGIIDWPRRVDHMQQHTGQHILSAAFVNLFSAETRGFRMLEQVCEIDVALDNPTDDRIDQAVDLANRIIWEDRPTSIRTVTPAEAATLPLRKEPAVEGELRIIEIMDFDLTPCGGTHAHRTGEVGIIAVRSWERAKGLTRIEFVAGGRALADYRRANETARRTAALFSAGRDDVFALAERMQEENKELNRRVRALEEIATRVEAEELLHDPVFAQPIRTSDRQGSSPTVERSRPDTSLTVSESRRGSSPTVREGSEVADHPSEVSTSTSRLITKVFDNRDAESLKRLALALVAHPQTIALLASHDKETARLVFARSSDASGDMNALMRKACEMIDGRGGGKPDLAQGGGKNIARLKEAIDSAAATLL